jgi:hypothetical protein
MLDEFARVIDNTASMQSVLFFQFFACSTDYSLKFAARTADNSIATPSCARAHLPSLLGYAGKHRDSSTYRPHPLQG